MGNVCSSQSQREEYRNSWNLGMERISSLDFLELEGFHVNLQLSWAYLFSLLDNLAVIVPDFESRSLIVKDIDDWLRLEVS